MSQSFHARIPGRGSSSRLLRVSAASLALMAAGCSADIARFDSTSFNLEDPPEASAPVPRAPIYGSNDGPTSALAQSSPPGPHGATGYVPPLSSRSRGIEREELPSYGSPEPGYGDDRASRSINGFAQSPRGQAVNEEQRQPQIQPTPIATGETITVAQGDTLYALSRRHGVSLSELMAVNNLDKPLIKPGQQLTLPATSAERPNRVAAIAPPTMTDAAPAAPVHRPSFEAASTASPDTLSRYGGSYTVKAGDSLYNIARTYKVPFTELQQVNGISDVRRVRPGTILRVPGAAPSAVEAIAEPAQENYAAAHSPSPAPDVASREPSQNAPPSHSARSAPSSDPSQPRILNGGERVANAGGTLTDAAPAAASGDSRLRWPVSGKIISGFGPKTDGTHNDGINLSVPLGTEVRAAENGVVAYAGSELKGYGALVLIRHDNGWVTAYAHNDELLVSRGDKVRRGQVVAKAGKSGSVDQPQVHFELRQDAKPVDPTPYMESM